MEKFILLVEDNEDDEALTLRALKKSHVLNKIEIVRDGEEALDFLFCRNKYASRNPMHTPEIILLDINLPKLSGLDVLKRIRENETTSILPVIVLTSSDEEIDIKKSYDLGANSYVRKPVDFDQFTQAIVSLGLYWMVLNVNPNKG